MGAPGSHLDPAEQLHELVPGRRAGLGVHPRQVEGDGAAGDEELLRDLRIAQSLQQQRRDLTLPIDPATGIKPIDTTADGLVDTPRS